VVTNQENPFVFGVPNVKQSENHSSNLYDAVIDSLISYIQEKQYSGEISTCDSQKDLVLYLPKSCNPLSYTPAADKKSIITSYNNSDGLLLDFIHSNTYVLFKSFDRKTLRWSEKGYISYRARLAPTLRSLKMKNLTSEGFVEDAIIFCETPGELKAKLKLREKIKKPFAHVYPILTKRSGLETVNELLNYGLDEFRRLQIEEALALIPGAARLKVESKMFSLSCRGEKMYVGTLIDMQACNTLDSMIKANQIPYVACYEWQVELYRDAVQIPEEKILVINN
jgi:hypothetical protein